MPQLTYTKKEVLWMIHHMLQNPDILIDAVQNEQTDHDEYTLLESAEKAYADSIAPQTISNILVD